MAYTSYTTFEVARFCGVTMPGVIRWVSQGKLKAYKTPGGHRRVLVKDLLDFLKRYKMPLPQELASVAMPRVLIVDDDPVIVNSLVRILRKASLSLAIETARDGFEAGKKSAEFHPDLVILDILLPGIDGFKVCQNLKNSRPEIKILAITGQASPNVRSRIVACGADSFLAKPFDVNDLIGQVGRLISIETIGEGANLAAKEAKR